MGKLALAAKITHVPSMYLSELPGPNHGCRQEAIDGLRARGHRVVPTVDPYGGGHIILRAQGI